MNGYFRKIALVVASAVFTAAFIVIMHFAIPQIECVPETSGEIEYSITVHEGDNNYWSEDKIAVIGENVTAVRISDLGKLKKITKVNYIPDKFVQANSLSEEIQIVDLTKPFDFAEKGTLIFVIMNLDPESSDFIEQSEKLSDYKIGDYWNFTLSLPKIFCASNIYNNANLVAKNGEIENYDFTAFTTSYDKKTEKFSQSVERTSVELQFYTRRQALNLYKVVTIHYQSAGTAYSGIIDCPLIGVENSVESVVEKSQNVLVAFSVFTVVVFAVLIVLSLLKRTKEFVTSIVWIFGILVMLFSRFMLGGTTTVPLFWTAMALSAVFIMLGGALLAQGRNFGKFPLKYIFPMFMIVGFITAYICPFVPFSAAAVLKIVYRVVKGIGSVALLGFIILSIFDKNDSRVISQTAAATVIAVACFASIFTPIIFPAQYNSMLWLSIITAAVTFIGVFLLFRDIEKANAYLTSNLNLEVDRQLKDIKSVISERDNLLRFVSHDMKKPLGSSDTLLDTLIEREKDEEQSKALRIVKQNNSRVIENLSEIGSYARFNYIAEPSRNSDLFEICAYLFDFHRPDCDANGIMLRNTVDERYKVFVKKQALENAVSNIILNAVEHANCSSITLSARSDKNRVILCIADDGKGIKDETDVFAAYVSEKSGGSGLGLYICKNIIESMNGELSYESKPGCTVFYISLLKA